MKLKINQYCFLCDQYNTDYFCLSIWFIKHLINFCFLYVMYTEILCKMNNSNNACLLNKQ